MERLKRKWGITSNLQFWIIMVVFAVTGSAVVWVRKPIFAMLGVGPTTSMFIKVPLWVAVVFPTYQVLLLVFGSLAGQFAFFWAFEKRMWGRLWRRR